MDSGSMHLLMIALWASVAGLVLPGVIAGMNSMYDERYHHHA
jgi:hypothetical protein